MSSGLKTSTAAVHSWSRVPNIDEPQIVSDADMAWMLAIAADRSLSGHERTLTFVELGSGEHLLAIERILTEVRVDGMSLPMVIFDELNRWLRGYAGSTAELRLRGLLADIRSGQYQPVPAVDPTDPARTGPALRAGVA